MSKRKRMPKIDDLWVFGRNLGYQEYCERQKELYGELRLQRWYTREEYFSIRETAKKERNRRLETARYNELSSAHQKIVAHYDRAALLAISCVSALTAEMSDFNDQFRRQLLPYINLEKGPNPNTESRLERKIKAVEKIWRGLPQSNEIEMLELAIPLYREKLKKSPINSDADKRSLERMEGDLFRLSGNIDREKIKRELDVLYAKRKQAKLKPQTAPSPGGSQLAQEREALQNLLQDFNKKFSELHRTQPLPAGSASEVFSAVGQIRKQVQTIYDLVLKPNQHIPEGVAIINGVFAPALGICDSLRQITWLCRKDCYLFQGKKDRNLEDLVNKNKVFLTSQVMPSSDSKTAQELLAPRIRNQLTDIRRRSGEDMIDDSLLRESRRLVKSMKTQQEQIAISTVSSVEKFLHNCEAFIAHVDCRKEYFSAKRKLLKAAPKIKKLGNYKKQMKKFREAFKVVWGTLARAISEIPPRPPKDPNGEDWKTRDPKETLASFVNTRCEMIDLQFLSYDLFDQGAEFQRGLMKEKIVTDYNSVFTEINDAINERLRHGNDSSYTIHDLIKSEEELREEMRSVQKGELDAEVYWDKYFVDKNGCYYNELQESYSDNPQRLAEIVDEECADFIKQVDESIARAKGLIEVAQKSGFTVDELRKYYDENKERITEKIFQATIRIM